MLFTKYQNKMIAQKTPKSPQVIKVGSISYMKIGEKTTSMSEVEVALYRYLEDIVKTLEKAGIFYG